MWRLGLGTSAMVIVMLVADIARIVIAAPISSIPLVEDLHGCVVAKDDVGQDMLTLECVGYLITHPSCQMLAPFRRVAVCTDP